jgi:hypothetical protein
MELTLADISEAYGVSIAIYRTRERPAGFGRRFFKGVISGLFAVAITVGIIALGGGGARSLFFDRFGGIMRAVPFILLIAASLLMKIVGRSRSVSPRSLRRIFPDLVRGSRPTVVRLEPDAVSITTPGQAVRWDRSRIRAIVETALHFVVLVGEGSVSVPERAATEQQIGGVRALGLYWGLPMEMVGSVPRRPGLILGLAVACAIGAILVALAGRPDAGTAAATGRMVNIHFPAHDIPIWSGAVWAKLEVYANWLTQGEIHDPVSGEITARGAHGAFAVDRLESGMMPDDAAADFRQLNQSGLLFAPAPESVAVDRFADGGFVVSWSRPLDGTYPGACVVSRKFLDPIRTVTMARRYRRNVLVQVCTPEMSEAALRAWVHAAIPWFDVELDRTVETR